MHPLLLINSHSPVEKRRGGRGPGSGREGYRKHNFSVKVAKWDDLVTKKTSVEIFPAALLKITRICFGSFYLFVRRFLILKSYRHQKRSHLLKTKIKQTKIPSPALSTVCTKQTKVSGLWVPGLC